MSAVCEAWGGGPQGHLNAELGPGAVADRVADRVHCRGMSNGSADVLYVSPHADDVAFSAAGQLARDVAAGARAVVFTVFEPPEPERRAEDERFAAAFSAVLERGAWA